MTELHRLLDELAATFERHPLVYGHGTDNAWDEAVALALGVLQWPDDRSQLERQVPETMQRRIAALARRRIDERLPVALLLGKARFADMELLVADDVMLPRSPIAELVRSGFRPWLDQPPARVLDLCCGGGAIGLACAQRFPEADVDCVDLAHASVTLAERNRRHCGFGERVQVRQGDLYAGARGRYDLIVSNPPYVPSAEATARPAECQHEPILAYDGGSDGMALVTRIVDGAFAHLGDAGLLVVEVGQFATEFGVALSRPAGDLGGSAGGRRGRVRA